MGVKDGMDQLSVFPLLASISAHVSQHPSSKKMYDTQTTDDKLDYSQCVPYGSFDGYVQGEKVKIDPSATVVSLPTSTTLSVMWEQCGGIGWGGPFACIPSQTCVFEDACEY